jgi:hypothetical protein
MIFSGAIAPAATVGTTGDFYIDLKAGLLYGPKSADGWGSGISIIGAPGAAGSAGATLLSGQVAPATSLGKTGDFYIDAKSMMLYGPKTTSSWGKGIALGSGTAATGSKPTPTPTKKPSVVNLIRFQITLDQSILGFAKPGTSLNSTDIKLLTSSIPPKASIVTILAYSAPGSKATAAAKAEAALVQSALRSIAPKVSVVIKILGSNTQPACTSVKNNCVVLQKTK